jgi:uncharacterized protein YutE (UPF0331/DUF86 family)
LTDPELVAKKLTRLETYLRELRTLARLEAIEEDVKERRFIEHTLLQAIQTAIDVASHIVSDEYLGEPSTQREIFEALGREKVIDAELAGRLAQMVGFRNVLVHNYVEFDLHMLRQVIRERLADLDRFVEAIRRRLPEPE